MKSAVIVGGASGIGFETARHFASAGVNTAIVDVDAGAIENATRALKVEGSGLIGAIADIRNRKAVDRAFAEIVDQHGQFDALVVTAGVLMPALLTGIAEADYDLTFDVNTKGFWICVNSALPYFPDRGGAIVAISSASGQRPKAGNGVYAASKAALQFLVRAFALELAPRKLRVNCVAPGTLETPMTARFASGPAEGGYKPSAAPPLGRLCTEEDVARAIAFLCSNEASFITGATLAVDGGLTAGVPLSC